MTPQQKFPLEKDLEKNRLLMIVEGASARTVYNLTSGAFLVGLLKYMGASDSFCGYVLALPVLATVIQVLSPIILESLRIRKGIIILGSALHRLLLVTLISTPFLPVSPIARLIIAAIIFLVSSMSLSFVTPAISSMYISFVPQNKRGKFFGGRESIMLFVATLITFIMSTILDIQKGAGNEIKGYLIAYIFVFFISLVNFLSFFLMKEVPLIYTSTRIKLLEIITLPLKNKIFIRYFVMLIIWNFAVQIASAYFSIYIKSDLGLSYTVITMLSSVNALTYVLMARIWGRFADKKGWAKTTMLPVGILSICHFSWFLCSANSVFLIPLLMISYITSGMAWSGINVALFNLQFDFTPDEKRTVYIGFSAAFSGFFGFISAAVGARSVGIFGDKAVMLFGLPYDIKQILFLISSFLLLICALYIFIFMRTSKTKKED
ncbi:MAG: MFS transporter [Acetivibrionales bacterium]|jgi:MFS family permease